MQNNANITKTTDVYAILTNESYLEIPANTSKEKTILASSSSIQEIYTDEHPKNSSTEEQQDTSRTNESNNT
ncbi:4662_t:CDS:2 [Scutellospora calospora]|uniref:4662_t:CDS:1 n=1 Tax=Scutellospora calospora TaxID=85575 RepID=A0ACA9KSZ8_9GLOM|nr:4662_t:CDS:2 [Scutellospora calospora]